MFFPGLVQSAMNQTVSPGEQNALAQVDNIQILHITYTTLSNMIIKNNSHIKWITLIINQTNFMFNNIDIDCHILSILRYAVH